jgi:NAD+ synthetase
VAVGLVICEDLWFAEPLADTVQSGAQLVVVPNASPFERDKHAQRDALLAMRSQESRVALAYLNVVGGQDALVFDGASVLTDADGHTHPAACAFEDHWLITDFDVDSGKFSPVDWPVNSDESREALAWRAIVRGTRDYCLKNGFGKVWIGLSGGIDSALVLAVAVDALGASNVTGVRLPSKYTSALSNDLADEQARALGVELVTVPIELPFKGFIDALGPLFGQAHPLPPDSHDMSEENLQSRCRGALLMALSNKFGGLLLTTGNKSEYAVGYATIYGDMCGGYAPIKDLYKTEVYALANWRNAQNMETGNEELESRKSSAIPQAVIDRAPSAELRENQTDQDSLPPYDVLDAILYRYIDQEESRDDILRAGFDAIVVDHVLRLVRINEWKRHQAAPGPKVSRRAFGRERRYPITSGWR